jgi:hypothetical protein
MHIFSNKKSALLTLTGCIFLVGVTLTVSTLLTNTATASHNNYEGTVTLDTQNQTANPDTADDTGKTVTPRGQVQFRLMNVDERREGSVVFEQAKLEVESPDDSDSDYGFGYFNSEEEERTIDSEDIELISVECKGVGCTESGEDWYWELKFGVIDGGGNGGSGDDCRVVDGNDLDWSGDPKSECAEAETQQYESKCTEETSSATLDVSDVPNSDEEIEKVTVELEARVECEKSSYNGESCSASGSYDASLGSQSVSGSASLSDDEVDDDNGYEIRTSSDTLTSDSATSISVDTSADANADKGIDNDSEVTASGLGGGGASVEVCEADSGSNTDPTANDEGTPSSRICTSDALDIDVLSKDTDEDGDSLQVVGLRASTSDSFASTTVTKNNGFANIIGNGTEDQDYHVRYIPDSAYTGPDSFQYKVSDSNGGTDTAMVYLDVQGEDGGCGDIRVSFDYTNDEGSPGGTADPTYDHATTSLDSQTTATSGEQLTWNVPLEVATNTAELIDDYIEPPEGYQLDETAAGDAKIKKNTELFDDFGRRSETDQTDENTSAWLGEDYTPDSFNACNTIGLNSTNTSPQIMEWEMTAYANDSDGDSLTYDWTFDGKDGPGGCSTNGLPNQKTIDGEVSDYDNEDDSTTCTYSVTVSDGQDSCTMTKGVTNQCGPGCDEK